MDRTTREKDRHERLLPATFQTLQAFRTFFLRIAGKTIRVCLETAVAFPRVRFPVARFGGVKFLLQIASASNTQG
jgi:hypothetical protein